MKKVVAIMLTVTVALTLVSTIWAAGNTSQVAYAVTGGNIYFDPTTGAIVGCDSTVTEAVIPSEINGVKVTNIGERAFQNCSRLESVIIPNGVFEIGSRAFQGCSNLTNVEMPDSVININNYAFEKCTSLSEIVLPSKIKAVSSYLFSGCTNLESVSIPYGVTTIDSYAFQNCASLKSIDITESVTTISTYSFANSGLTSVYISKNITSIAGGSSMLSFLNCSKLAEITVDSDNPNYMSVDGVLFAKNTGALVCYPAGKTDESYSIPAGTLTIGGYAFSGNIYLNSVTVPEGCNFNTINYTNAFSGCSNLTTVTFPMTISKIPTYTFDQCYRITDVYYGGCAERWDKITIGSNNGSLPAANMHYNDSDYFIDGIELEVGETQTIVRFEPLQSDNYYSYRILYKGQIMNGNSSIYYVNAYPAQLSMTIPIGTENLPRGGEPSDYLIEVYASSLIGSAYLSDGVAHEHSYTGEWLSDGNSHWHKCTKCSEKIDFEKHILVNGICTVCGYVLDASHTHTLTYGTATEVHWDYCDECGYTGNVATHTFNNGVCTICGKAASSNYDVNGDGEVDSLDSVILLRHLVGLD